MRRLSVTTAIDAPAALVWQVLVDTERYGEWNPFITDFSGELVAGRRLRVRIAPPGGRPMTFRPVVTEVEHGRRLAWLGRAGLPGIFDGAHSFTLTSRPEGGVDLTQGELFRGVLVPAMATTLERTEAGFAAMNEALRGRAESLARPGSLRP